MQHEVQRHYRTRATLIHNPCDVSVYETSLNGSSSGNPSEASIVFTGDVYEAHFDAFRNLVAAIDLVNSPNVKLHLFTNRSPSYLAEKGIRGPVVCHKPVPSSAIPEIQRRADILFLPLAFNSPYPEVIKTSAPSKLGEYLASKRPILVHAPSDSFLVWYFRKYNCGIVVDQQDPEVLRGAIEEILDNIDLQQRLCTNAWNCVLTDFSIQTAQTRFSELMKLDPHMWASS